MAFPAFLLTVMPSRLIPAGFRQVMMVKCGE
jgi:hypothetical protein